MLPTKRARPQTPDGESAPGTPGSSLHVEEGAERWHSEKNSGPRGPVASLNDGRHGHGPREPLAAGKGKEAGVAPRA